MIIGGEHRWKVARVKGMIELPCFVHEDWDETKQKLKTVRNNLIGGSLDQRKFTALVKSLDDSVDISQMPDLFGFDNAKEFEKYLLKDKDTRDKSFIDGLVDESKKEKFAVDSLTDIISTIFSECGATIDQNYLFFAFKGSLQMALLCDKDTWASVQLMVNRLRETGETATSFIKTAIDDNLDGK